MHRGNEVKKVLNDIGIKISTLAKRLDMAKSTLYKHLDNENLAWRVINKIGLEINYDFREIFEDFPSSMYSERRIVSTKPEDDKNPNDSPQKREQLIKEIDYWKNKYIKLLEEHSELLKRQLN